MIASNDIFTVNLQLSSTSPIDKRLITDFLNYFKAHLLLCTQLEAMPLLYQYERALTCLSIVTVSDIDGNDVELEDFMGDDRMMFGRIRTQGHGKRVHRTWKLRLNNIPCPSLSVADPAVR